MPTLLSCVKVAARLRWIYRATGLAAVVTTAEPLTPQSPRATPEEIGRAVDSVAARIVASGLSPGLGVAIAMDGRTIFSKAYGWADATNRIRADDRTLWYVASTSKSYTGFGVALLAAGAIPVGSARRSHRGIRRRRDQIRIEIAGTGSTVAFRFDGPGAARSLELMGETFVRR